MHIMTLQKSKFSSENQSHRSGQRSNQETRSKRSGSRIRRRRRCSGGFTLWSIGIRLRGGGHRRRGGGGRRSGRGRIGAAGGGRGHSYGQFLSALAVAAHSADEVVVAGGAKSDVGWPGGDDPAYGVVLGASVVRGLRHSKDVVLVGREVEH